jgi:hypothetical protein
MGEWRYSSTILDPSFIPWMLYTLGNSSQYPKGRMGGPQSWMLWGTEESFLYQESNPRHPGQDSRLRHYVMSQMVAVSFFPDEVIGFFN